MRRPRNKLDEGLREGDLVDLVLPLLSVDEYESKTSPSDAVVIGFYVHDESAAKDLNRFIQKSSVSLLGSEVSPAPDQHGYFMTFVEFLNNDRLPESLSALLHEMSALVDIEDWSMRVRRVKGLRPYTEDTLKTALRALKIAERRSDILEFLQTTALRHADVEGTRLLVEGSGERLQFHILDFDRQSKLLQQDDLREAPLRLSMRDVAKTNRIAQVLGEHWQASLIGSCLMVHHHADPRALLLGLEYETIA
jgi:hypothetical protein